ncbi:MAG TPA: hypothetical protein VK474_06845 [Chthoniobacterales bacterium]|nr:hypothetical protein [Chthoniobacterales bacterium]
MNMLENATFAAALVAAFVSLLNAMYNKRNASDLENLKTQLQQGLDKLRDRLERERQLEGFNRERIKTHIDQIFDAFVEVSVLADISGKTQWVMQENHMEEESQFKRAINRIKTYVAVLVALGAISSDENTDIEISRSTVTSDWDDMMGEVARKDLLFREKNPLERQYSSSLFFDKNTKLIHDIGSLRESLARISPKVTVPAAS